MNVNVKECQGVQCVQLMSPSVWMSRVRKSEAKWGLIGGSEGRRRRTRPGVHRHLIGTNNEIIGTNKKLMMGGGDRYENWKKKVKVTVKSWITLSLSIQIHFQFRDSQKTTLYKKDTLATDDTYDDDDSDDSDNGACKWGPKVGRCSPRSAQVSCKLHAQIIEALWIPNHHQCLQNLPRKHVTISDITILEIAVYMNDYDSILII